MSVNSVIMVIATAILGLLVFQWFQKRAVMRRNRARRRWEEYKRLQMVVWSDGRVLIRRGGDPATDEWRDVKSPETLVALACDNGWTVVEHWRPSHAADARAVLVKG